ncbi:MAG: hypothetical protein NXI31_01520 [bacterium]|nr:hypothetical protein [bacterium]
MKTPIPTSAPTRFSPLPAAGLAALLAMTTATTGTITAQNRPPSGRKLDDLVKRYLALDHQRPEGFAAGEELLAPIANVPALSARDVASWKKKLGKFWKKGKKLEKSGDNLFFDGATGRYIVGGYKGKKPKGLAIAMHGGGVGSGDAGPAAGAYGPALSKLGWVMIAPQVLERTECGWTDSGSEEFVLELVDCALRTWKIDPDHVYFVGHSMGGYGSWTLGAHHADRVAAVAPSAGAPTPIRRAPGSPIIDVIEGVIPSLRNVYVSCYQSTDDQQVPPAPNQFAVKLLGEAQQRWGGFAHDYWEVHNRGHGSPPGGYPAHLAKIADKVRNPIPERIVWQPVLDWKRQFYWLYWEKPVKNAIVEADLDRKKNAITITTKQDTKDLYVLLDERMVDLDKEVTVTVNGKQTFKGKVERRLETLLRTSLHPDPKLQFVARVPAH